MTCVNWSNFSILYTLKMKCDDLLKKNGTSRFLSIVSSGVGLLCSKATLGLWREALFLAWKTLELVLS